jgi:AraC-like DNA-binding protein
MVAGLHRPELARVSLSVRVSSLISARLERGRVGVEAVASQLHMSRYTLHKKLRREGLTFASLLEEVRRKQALTYLQDKTKPLVEIAEQLGFSELSAFSRAFKRWMGVPPAEYRSVRLS